MTRSINEWTGSALISRLSSPLHIHIVIDDVGEHHAQDSCLRQIGIRAEQSLGQDASRMER